MAVLDLEQKLGILMSLAEDDRDGRPAPPRLRHATNSGALGPLNIRNLRTGPGRRTSLLRVLMTNACSFNCHYCPMRRDRDLPRTLLKPEELVRIFLGALRRGWCEGLFITTGIPGRPAHVTDELIKALALLRETHGFAGYIHVKLPPGADEAQIERLTRLASRVSMNFEAACGASLAPIAPEKSWDATRADFERVRAIVVREREARAYGRPPDALHPGGVAGLTMQFVVGATPDTDRTFIDTVAGLRKDGGVHHPQFSAFRPIARTPMEERPATPALREHRLYQAAHLLTGYGFEADEVVYQPNGNLPLTLDPKAAWALSHPERFPVEVRSAPYRALVRVPGIGPGTARRIVAERATTILRGLPDLKKIGVIATRAAGFLTLAGRRLASTRWTEQLGFWAPEDEAGAYHVTYEVSPGTFR
ncbi:MAG TPA: radical SAM protein [Gemmatimonadales bacterium]|nr:radical SAM protein [Gemmatimonadales bacterium]